MNPIVTTPSDALHCKVPFDNYASCVIAQNTMGIVLYLRDSKVQNPQCFCKGSQCATPPPSTMEPYLTTDANGSLPIPSLTPFVTYENETFPGIPENNSFPVMPTLPSDSNMPSDDSGLPSQNSDIPSGPPGQSGTPPPPDQSGTPPPPVGPTNPPPVGPTPPPGAPTTTTVYDNPNTVAFTKGSNFDLDNFKNKLGSTLGIPTTSFTVIPNPRNSSQIIVAFNTGNKNTDATLVQRSLNLSTASLTEMGATSASAAASEGSYTTSAPVNNNNDEKKSNLAPIIGGVVGAIVVFACVGYYIYSSNNKSRSSNDAVGNSYAAHQDFNDFRGNINAEELGNANNRGQFSPTEHSV
jgi:hypothetical protein